MNDADYETPEVYFAPACPGCEDYDPRRNAEAWCLDCRPENGTLARPIWGDLDGAVRAAYVGTASSSIDPENQRAAARFVAGSA